MSNPNTNNASIIQQFLEENVAKPTAYQTLDPSQFPKPDIQAKTKEMMDTVKEGQSVTNRIAYIDPTSATGYNQNIANVNAANKAMYENTIQKIANQVASNITAAEKTRQLTKGTPYEDEPFTGRFFVSRIGKDKAGQFSDPVTIDESIDSKWRDTSRPMTPEEKEKHFQDWYRSQDGTRFANEAEARAQYSNEGQDQNISMGKELAGGSWKRTQVQEGHMSGGAYDTRPFMVRSVAPVTIESQTPYAAAPEWKPKVMTDEIKVSKREKGTGDTGTREEKSHLYLSEIGVDDKANNVIGEQYNTAKQYLKINNLDGINTVTADNLAKMHHDGRSLSGIQLELPDDVRNNLKNWKVTKTNNDFDDILTAYVNNAIIERKDGKLWKQLSGADKDEARTRRIGEPWKALELHSGENILPVLAYQSAQGQTQKLTVQQTKKLYEDWKATNRNLFRNLDDAGLRKKFVEEANKGSITYADAGSSPFVVTTTINSNLNAAIESAAEKWWNDNKDKIPVIKPGKYKNIDSSNIPTIYKSLIKQRMAAQMIGGTQR